MRRRGPPPMTAVSPVDRSAFWCSAVLWAPACSAMSSPPRWRGCRMRSAAAWPSCSNAGRRIWRASAMPTPPRGYQPNSTVTELAIAGRPSILVPLPGAIDDHQTANARSLAEAGGAWVMPQPTFTAEALAERLENLFPDPGALALAAVNARAAARPGAAQRLADLVERVAREDATIPMETAR